MKPKPKGKDAKKIRAMLREGVPPHAIPFDLAEVNKIYRKFSFEDRQKIVRTVNEARVDMTDVIANAKKDPRFRHLFV